MVRKALARWKMDRLLVERARTVRSVRPTIPATRWLLEDLQWRRLSAYLASEWEGGVLPRPRRQAHERDSSDDRQHVQCWTAARTFSDARECGHGESSGIDQSLRR